MGGSPQKMLARKFTLCDRERHYILKLVAKAVRAAQLIKSSARPDAARQRLIEQPPIQEHIHGSIRAVVICTPPSMSSQWRVTSQDLVQVRGTITAE